MTRIEDCKRAWLNDEYGYVTHEGTRYSQFCRASDHAVFNVNNNSLKPTPTWLSPEVKVKLLRPSAKVPQYMTDGAAGADVFADLADPNLMNLPPHEAMLESEWGDIRMDEPGVYKVPLGIALEIPPGWVGLLKDRSGNYLKGVDGHVAAIDSDYRGQLCMLVRVDDMGDLVTIKHGDRVGQIIFAPVGRAQFKITDELSETARGQGGFGSTGTR